MPFQSELRTQEMWHLQKLKFRKFWGKYNPLEPSASGARINGKQSHSLLDSHLHRLLNHSPLEVSKVYWLFRSVIMIELSFCQFCSFIWCLNYVILHAPDMRLNSYVSWVYFTDLTFIESSRKSTSLLIYFDKSISCFKTITFFMCNPALRVVIVWEWHIIYLRIDFHVSLIRLLNSAKTNYENNFAWTPRNKM